MDKIAEDRGAEAIEDKNPAVSDEDVFDTSFSEAIEEDNPTDDSKTVESNASIVGESKVEPVTDAKEVEDKSKIVVIDAEERLSEDTRLFKAFSTLKAQNGKPRKRNLPKDLMLYKSS